MEFLVVGGIGLAVLVLSLIIGEVFDFHGILDSDIFSIASLSAFAGAFGFSGAAAQEAWGSMLVTLPVAVVMGLVFSGFTIWLTRGMRGLHTDQVVNTHTLVGHEGRVLTPVPEGGYGEVVIRVGGHSVKYSAKSPIVLEAGQRVWVSHVLSATAVEVSPVDAITDPTEGPEGAPAALPPT